MYNPQKFAAPNDETIQEIVRAHPFATLITPMPQGLQVSHVPLVLEVCEGEWILIGHLARANPHAQALEGGESLAIFHGPHAYISPLWYTENDVPTWNYVVAHLHGRAKLLESEEGTTRALEKLSAHTHTLDGWGLEIPADLREPGALLRAIVGFEIAVTKRIAKTKLSQNRAERDRVGVRKGLESRNDEGSQGILAWMQRSK